MVGAPFFFERQKELGGAVYVYMNQGGHWDEISPLRICGSPDSMFGISVAVLGDLNQDGFPGVTGHSNGSGARQGEESGLGLLKTQGGAESGLSSELDSSPPSGWWDNFSPSQQ